MELNPNGLMDEVNALIGRLADTLVQVLSAHAR